MMKIDIQKELGGSVGNYRLSVQADLKSGCFLGIIGPSGTGKTSLLRMIAGLLEPDQGRIEVDGQLWFDSDQRKQLEVRDRSLGMVFQDYALFPHMSVEENLHFALPKGFDGQTVKEWIRTMELTELASRKASMLSGGQQQRVALARALIRKPRVLLLDEALAASDQILRSRLLEHLKEFHLKNGGYVFMVSHEPAEVLPLADEFLELPQGKIHTSPMLRKVHHSPYIPCRILRITRKDEQVELELWLNSGRFLKSISEEEAAGLTVGGFYLAQVH